jgi:hypothetical protein
VHIGEPLVNFQGVMTGVPKVLGGEFEAKDGR